MNDCKVKINSKFFDKFEKIKWIILGLLFFGMFIIFLYDDLVITYTHSLNFLDCLFGNNILGFYEYTMDRMCLGYPADYYMIIYLIFGIWNFPIWLMTKIWKIDPYSAAALLWAKAILIPFIMGGFFIIHKMFEIMKEKDSEHLYFMMCSSLLFVLPIAVMGQYDIISLFFILWGILQCVKEDKVSWKAVLLFAAAIPIKIFAVFPVSLIILLKEKRIIEIIKKLFVSMLGLGLCILPYIANPAFYEATQYNGGWFGKLSKEVLPSGWSGISIFWISFFALCIIAYKMRQNHIKEFFKQIIWLLSAFYCLFFIFVEAHPQWSVLLVPFLILLIRNENQDFKLNVLLETIAGVSLAISQAYHFHWVYCTDTTSWLLLKGVSERSNLLWLTSLRDIHMVENFVPMFNAAYLACVVGILVINNPWRKANLTVKSVDEKEICLTKIGIDTLRILIILGYMAVTFMIIYVV